MKTAFRILARDLGRLARNPVALIVMAGLIVLPALYAWYCIWANWDPYGNTGNIRVAVANADAGADTEALGHIDVGSQVEANLQDDDQLGWEFVSEDEAVQGVESGRYYAAYVIPADFSADFASVLTGKPEHPTITYYANEKHSAVATKVTDSGATAFERKVNEQFASAASEAASSAARDAAKSVKGEVEGANAGVAAGVAGASDDLSSVREALASASEGIDGWKGSVSSARTTLGDAKSLASSISSSLDTAGALMTSAQADAGSFSASASGALTKGSVALGGASSQASIAVGKLAAKTTEAKGDVDAAIASLNKAIDRNDEAIAALKALASADPSVSKAIDDLQVRNDRYRAAVGTLQETSDALDAAVSAANGHVQAMGGIVSNGLAGISSSAQSVNTTITPQVTSGLGSLSTSLGLLSGVSSALGPQADQALALLDQLDGTLGESASALDATASTLATTQTDLSSTASDLAALSDSLEIDELSQILGIDPADVGDFMASPVTLTTKVVYPVENYGSSVAPFYTNLALWVGGFVLMALIKLEVDREGIEGLTATRAYLGRWLLFMVLSILQALVICMGDLVIGVQCENPVAFLAAGVLTSLAYMNIIFMLGITLRHIGKAAAVILLIMQIPGSSGMYPIEMMPGFFRMVHPLLPFTYGIDAMRQAMAGIYGHDLAFDAAILLSIVLASLFIGLVVRPYVLNLNVLFDAKLHETGFLVSEEQGMRQSRYRARNVIRALLDTDTYRAMLLDRAERFNRSYDGIVRVGSYVVAALPLVLMALVSFVNVDVDDKLMLLAGMIALVILVDVFLIVVEFLHESLGFQLRMAGLGGDALIDDARDHLPLRHHDFSPDHHARVVEARTASTKPGAHERAGVESEWIALQEDLFRGDDPLAFHDGADAGGRSRIGGEHGVVPFASGDKADVDSLVSQEGADAGRRARVGGEGIGDGGSLDSGSAPGIDPFGSDGAPGPSDEKGGAR